MFYIRLTRIEAQYTEYENTQQAAVAQVTTEKRAKVFLIRSTEKNRHILQVATSSKCNDCLVATTPK